MGNKLSALDNVISQSSLAGSDRTVIITGVTSGIGTEVAVRVAQLGASHIVCPCRNVKKCGDIIDLIKSKASDKSIVIEMMAMDLNNLESVASFADSINQRNLNVALLISNAGVFRADKSKTGSTVGAECGYLSYDGIDVTMQTNAIAPYLLVKKLMPALDRCPNSRCVFVSSIAHKKTPTIDFENIVKCQQKRGAWSAYAQSKLALMMVVKELSCIHNNITFVYTPLVYNAVPLVPSCLVSGACWILTRFCSLIGTYWLRTPYHGAVPVVFGAICNQLESGSYVDSTGDVQQPHPDVMDSDKRVRLLNIFDNIVSQYS